VAEVHIFRTDDAPDRLLEDARAVVFGAFEGGFSEDDWSHALGGWHAVVTESGRVVAHASVILRQLEIGNRKLAAGYVEGVGTESAARGEGHGTRAMTEIAKIIRRDFELGALSTEAHKFYERLGWERWRGPTLVRSATGLTRTEDEDEGIMVLRFGRSASIDLTASISCEERSGDDW
jgi:aminoglycoside 2'-N-acetyltransferase I